VPDGSSEPASAPSRLVVLAGPTAVGKGTVAACVRRDHPEIWISVSVTTRPARPGEIDGVHYHFISDEEFDRLIAEDGLLEWAVVHQAARYGTPRAPVEARLAAGTPALLEIDLQGARQVRERMPDALMCFLAPPSWGELERRLVGRGTEGPEERERRLATARTELAAESEFDVTIVNTDVRTACQELVDLFRSGTSRICS
jgi:guanylate kinase